MFKAVFREPGFQKGLCKSVAAIGVSMGIGDGVCQFLEGREEVISHYCSPGMIDDATSKLDLV